MATALIPSDLERPGQARVRRSGRGPRCEHRRLGFAVSTIGGDVHAVVVKVAINDREAAEKRLREETVPRVSQLPGVVAGYWTRSDSPDGLSMVVFESEETARAAADQVPQMISEALTLESVEVREVVANV
jgi:hypothetical protein